MKKILAGIALLAMTTQMAYATQARLIALGLDELDNEGSYYIEDQRNIFLNSANVNSYGDMVIFEYGGSGRAVGNGETLDQDFNSKAQGGFLKKHGNMVYGAYLGNESNTSSFLRIASTSNAVSISAAGVPRVPTADNQIDLFAGSSFNNGIKWGANLVYLNNEDNSSVSAINKKQEDKAGAVRLGVMADRWDAHANISFMNEAKNTVAAAPAGGNAAQTVNQEFDGSLGIHVGGSYKLNKGRVYGFYKTFQWDQKDDYNYTGWVTTSGVGPGKTGKSEGKFDTYSLGYGRVESVNSNGNIFTNIQLKVVDVELKAASTVQVKNTTVPLTMGYEHAANSWLTLRGSITHNLYGKKDNKNFSSANAVVQSLVGAVYGSEGKGSIPNSTIVNAGATLTFGKLNVDGVIGTAGTNGASATGAKNGALDLDRLMAKAAVTYKF